MGSASLGVGVGKRQFDWELPAGHGDAVGRGFQAQGTASVKKGPEAGPCLVCLGNMEEASVAGTEEEEEEEEVRQRRAWAGRAGPFGRGRWYSEVPPHACQNGHHH